MPRRLALSCWCAGWVLFAPALAAENESAKATSSILGQGGMSAPGGFGASGKDAKGPDGEAQLREIESTKKLMKALGEMNAPQPGGADKAGEAAKQGAAANAARKGEAAEGGTGVLKGMGIPGELATDLREAAGAASKAARAVGLTADPDTVVARGTAGGGSGSSARGEETARSRPAASESEFQELLDKLIDEFLPWAIGIAVLLALTIGIFSWAAARGQALGAAPQGKGSNRGSRKRRGSRRRGQDLRHAPVYQERDSKSAAGAERR